SRRAFIGARLARVRHNSERGCVIPRRQHGTDKLESFKILLRFLIARRCVPRIENNYVRLKLTNCCRQLRSKILTVKAHSKGRWWTDEDIVFERATVQLAKHF